MSPNDSAERLLLISRKYGRFCIGGRVTPEELVTLLFDNFADDAGQNTHLAGEIVAALPEAALGELRRRVEEARGPEYRHPAWHGVHPADAVLERERESDLLTQRIRSWATALAEHLRR